MTSSRESLWIVAEALQPKAGGFKAAVRRREARDWMGPMRLANEHLLAAAMYAALAQAHRLAALPCDVADYLALLHRNNVERNEALRRQALEMLAAFNAADIPAMMLKGALSLFLDHYPDRGARMFRDLDVLVPPESMARAIAVLEDLGYAATTKYQPIQHAYAEFMRANDPGAVDLHVELIDAHYILPQEEIWARAEAYEVDGIRFHLPSATDRILHNFLHAEIHHLGNYYRGSLKLQQAYDFTLLVRHRSSEIDWTLIEDRMHRHGLDTALQSYALAATALFGLAWPLSAPASIAAHFHFRRCMAQLCVPALESAMVPWANLRGAFASHRMKALYGDTREPIVAHRLHHALGFIRKSTAKGMLDRLFRMS
jgi:hypothetical protein